jgi:23S rRNA pseudouridine1911/1915/1917 synthase
VKPSLKVIYEDNHLLVINKDADVVTQGALADESSVYDMATEYIKHKYQKPGNVYLGVVSRLDRMVTGVLVLTRTSKAAARLNDQFRGGLVEKKYLALAENNFRQTSGQLTHWLVKNDSLRKMQSVEASTAKSTNPPAKKAVLNYRVIGQNQNTAVVEVELLTGRKHQIRAQLSAIGCPILGDRKYGSSQPFPRGIALHSYQLGFDHPTKNEKMEFRCSPPNWWPLETFGVRF